MKWRGCGGSWTPRALRWQPCRWAPSFLRVHGLERRSWISDDKALQRQMGEAVGLRRRLDAVGAAVAALQIVPDAPFANMCR